jgi:hypothetical protein
MIRKKRSPSHGVGAFLSAFVRRVRANKACFCVYAAMGAITMAIIVLTFTDGQYESTFTAVLSLFLFLIPTLVSESLRIKLPEALEIVSVLFVFCANILGEIFSFYTLLPFWDDMLHYTSGFIFAAFGFSLVEIFNRNERFDFQLSPFFVATVALCFAVTVGVLWEFFEFGADLLLHTDMQKDRIVHEINSALLNQAGQSPVTLEGITGTLVTDGGGTQTALEGYLDIGLFDTMKDLFVDFCGALLFCSIGYFYMGHSSRARLARRFIPRVEKEERERQENA